MDKKIQVLAVRVVLRRKRFRRGWYRFNEALHVNGGDWPSYYAAARAIAAATNSCDFNRSIAGRASYNAWNEAMKLEFSWAWKPYGWVDVGRGNHVKSNLINVSM